MSIATRTMLHELDTLRDRLDRFFGEAPGIGGVLAGPIIDLDFQELDDSLFVKATVPGIKAEDLTVEVRNGVLTIQGETREELEEAKGTWHRRERHVGQVYRAVTLPTAVNETEAQAELHDGVLEIRFPKAEPGDRHPIPVKTGRSSR